MSIAVQHLILSGGGVDGALNIACLSDMLAVAEADQHMLLLL